MSIRKRVTAAVAAVITVAGCLVSTGEIQIAEAAQTVPPSASRSFYVNDVYVKDLGSASDVDPTPTSFMYQAGRDEAKRQATTPCDGRDFLVILQFGAIRRKGTVLGGSNTDTSSYAGYGVAAALTNGAYYVPLGIVKRAAFQFAAGYWPNSGSVDCRKVKIAIGTNNSSICTGSTISGCSAGQFGTYLAYAVKDVVEQGINRQSGTWYRQIYIWAAGDWEPPWSTYAPVRDLVEAYNAILNDPNLSGEAYGARIYNDGSVESGYWTDLEIYHISYEVLAAYALPEVYTAGQVTRWNAVQDSAVAATGRLLRYDGVLSDCPNKQADGTVDFSATAAWNALWTKIQSKQGAYGLPYSSVISAKSATIPGGCG